MVSLIVTVPMPGRLYTEFGGRLVGLISLPWRSIVATVVPAVHDDACPPPACELAAAVAMFRAMPSVGYKLKAGSHGVLVNRHSDSTVAFAVARAVDEFVMPLTCSETVPEPIGVPSFRTTWNVCAATDALP